MDLLRCALGLIPCGRLWPETAYELVVLVFVVAFSLLELAVLASPLLLAVAAAVWWRARRRRAVESDVGQGNGPGCER